MSEAARRQPSRVPPHEQWPEPPPHTEAGKLLTDLVIATVRLNGRLLDVAQDLAAQGGITAAWWQVLGGVLDEPRTIADVGRRMGMTRQAVQRVADLVVNQGLAEFRDNPAHRRAKLLACTQAGYWAVRQITLVQHPWSNRVGTAVGIDHLRAALTTTERLMAALDSDSASRP